MPPEFSRQTIGKSVRISPGNHGGPRGRFCGLVKLRLGHANYGSLLLPELLFLKLGGWRFYQPVFFSPPLLTLGAEGVDSEARFSVDVSGPRGKPGARLSIKIRSDGLAKVYDDGAQLYECEIDGPVRLLQFASGRCALRNDGDFDLQLSHITNPVAYSSIRKSAELRSSTWNLQGTRQLANVAYVYLTSLASIKSEEDLRRIAMSSGGMIEFKTTSFGLSEEVLKLNVYRESTSGRTANLQVVVASDLLSPPHLLIHRPVFEPAYYEVVGPEIYRVGLQPGCSLTYGDPVLTAPPENLKRFDCVVVGDTSTIEGISAPYDEEETNEIIHLDRLSDVKDLFFSWQEKQNSDQFSNREPEMRQFLLKN